MMEKMFKSPMSPTLPASLPEERRRSLQKGLSFISSPRTKAESEGRWRDIMKQLHDKRRKVYDIVNKLHDQRLSEQQVVMDDIEQGLSQVHSDSKDLQQLQLDRNKIKTYPDRLSECQTVLEKVKLMPPPADNTLDTALVDSKRDKEILEHCLASFERANQMLETCENLTEKCQKTISVLKRKITHKEDEILYQIDQLNDWLEDTYNMFTWIPNNLPYAYQYLIVDWKKMFNDMGIKYGDFSLSDSTMLPGESSVDAEYEDPEPEPEPSAHSAECIAGMIEDMLSVEKLEARAHQLELCKARGNLIATETEVSPQLEYIQKLWGHLKQCGNLRVSELLFAVKLQEAHRLVSEGQEELYNFDEEFIDLDQETLEAEATDFRAFFYEIEYFTSLERVKDEMASNLEAYLKLCPPGSDPTLLNGEVQSLKQNHEEMCIEVESLWKFLEEGLETLKRFHDSIAKFEEWLATAEEAVYRNYYGNSYQELLTYYNLVKSFINDLIPREDDLNHIADLDNTILDHCSDNVEEQLQERFEQLNDRWLTVSDIIVNLEVSVYQVIQWWAAYEKRYNEVETFIADVSSQITDEPLESSDKDFSLLPKYKTLQKEIGEHRPEYEELVNSLAQNLVGHEKLGTNEEVESSVKQTITSNMDELRTKWDLINDNVNASVDMLQRELSDWFSSIQAQLQAYITKADQLLQQMSAVVSVDAKYDDSLNDQIQSTNKIIENHSNVCSEENSQNFYALLDEVYERRPPADLETVDISELDYEPLSPEDIAKIEAIENTWNIYWDHGKRYLILLNLRVKVLEYMMVILEGQKFCSRHFEIDLEGLENALYNYKNKFNDGYFDSLQSQKEEIQSVANEFTKSCPEDGDDELPKGDSDERVLAQLQESCDTLTTTVNDRHAILAQYIALWKNYNSSKDVVEATIEEVQNDVEELTERSGDPAVPPTIIVENAKRLKQDFENKEDMKETFISAKEQLAAIVQEQSREIEAEITEEMIQKSTEWHNLGVKLNQFISQASRHSEEFVEFVNEVSQLATAISELKQDIETEVEIELPNRGTQEYARTMIERRDALQTLQGRCDKCQQNNVDTGTRGESWKPTPIPQELLADYPADFKLQPAADEIDGVTVHPTVEEHFTSLAEQVEALQTLLNKREDQLDKNEETVLIFKGLADDLLNWINQQCALPVMNKLPDADSEQLEEDIGVVQSIQQQLDEKLNNDKVQLDEQRKKLERRNLRDETRQELEKYARSVDEALGNLENKVTEQLERFENAKQELVSFLEATQQFEEWLNERDAEVATCWPVGANLPLLIEKGDFINEVKNSIDDKLVEPKQLTETEETIQPLFDPDSLPAISSLPVQLSERYDNLVEDCDEKTEAIEDAKNALQQFMATYEEFEKWLNATLDDATTRAETKHCVGVTEKKLEEHKEYVAETIEVKVEEFNTLKENSAPLLQKYPPSDWLEGKMKEITDKWDALWKCCGDHQSHLEKLLDQWVTYERTVSGLLDWVMTEAETFAKEVTTRGDKGVEDHIHSCEELYASLEDKKATMDEITVLAQDLAEHDVPKENGTDDISSRKNDVVQHWDSLINLLAETLLRLESTFAELRHVLQVLEEESDLIGGLETRAALPPTCYGNTEVLSQQMDHFQTILEETESHNEKVSYLHGYLEFVEEHSRKDDREPRQDDINDVVSRHAKLTEQCTKVVTLGRQALPIWQEYNDTTVSLSDWMTECDQKLCSPEYQSGNAITTKQSLENSKVLLADVVTQQTQMDNTTGQSSALTPFCLTEDDQQYLANNTTQHVEDYQALLENCRARVLLLEQRELTWQNFPVSEATAVQEILDSVDKTVDVEFDEVTLAADMYTFLEQLEELEAKQAGNEEAVAAIDTSMDDAGLQQASQENPDINKEKDRLLGGFANSKARLAEKLAKVKAQVKAVSQLEAAINNLEECIHHHRAIVLGDLPVGPILEVKQEKMKKAGVHSQAELTSAVQNLNAALAQFDDAIQIGVPPDLNQRAENLKEACPEILEAGEQWPARIDTAVANWIDIKEKMGQLNGWLSTAESEFNSIQSIPKFLTDFPALEDRFQLHADSLQDEKEEYDGLMAAVMLHVEGTEEIVVAQRRKVEKLSQRWDALNSGLGELEIAMVPWKQLLDARENLEQFLAPLEQLYEVEFEKVKQSPPGSDFSPFIVHFKDCLRKMDSSESLLLDLQQKMAVSLTEEVYKKHVPARKLHQICEQLIERWDQLKQDFNTILHQVQDQVDEWVKNAIESIDSRKVLEEEMARVREELQAQKEYSAQLENRYTVLPTDPVMSDDYCCPLLIIILCITWFLFLLCFFTLLEYQHENRNFYCYSHDFVEFLSCLMKMIFNGGLLPL
ncbi:uncharacterized protein [Dysidea avara]|uniref:uncharacterized protein isoform X3 n=1 Tax=Dysidea avara TaxID=196820 RepID=UPI0033326095